VAEVVPFLIVLMGDDLIAKETCRSGVAMRDQGLVLREFELEVIAQEGAQATLDLFRFLSWSREPDQPVVGLCRVSGYADCARRARGPARAQSA